MKQKQITLLCRFFLLLNLYYHSVIHSDHSEFPKDIYLMAYLNPLNADVVFDL